MRPDTCDRQQAGVGPDHGDDGNSDVRKHVGRHVEHRLPPEQYDEDRQNDEGVRPAQGNEDNLVHPRNLTSRRDSPVPVLRDQSRTAALSTMSLRDLPQPCSSPAFNRIKNSLPQDVPWRRSDPLSDQVPAGLRY